MRSATCALPYRKSVRAPPGSTIVTPIPKRATSWATDSAKPSMPHLVAWHDQRVERDHEEAQQ
jgi:hypothetical protein